MDDEASLLGVVGRALSQEGYQVSLAGGWDEALPIFTKTSPDLVITDLRMPHVDGLELLRYVRSVSSGTEVIVITGQATTEKAIACVRSGAHDFLLKPFDITELLHSVKMALEHKNLLGERRELERLDTLRREFVANISHELKTPLMAVRGALDAVLENKPPDGSLEGRSDFRLFDILDRNVKRLSSLVSQIMDISRMEAGEMKMHPIRMDPAKVITESAEEIMPAFLSKNVELALQLGKLSLILADPEKLKQVLLNLLSNSLKFTEAGGVVRLEAWEDGNLEIKILDTGCGIPAGEIPKIFQKFYQVDTTLSRQAGTGIGLSLVKHIVEAHKGKVWCESEVGKGSKFFVQIPIN